MTGEARSFEVLDILAVLSLMLQINDHDRDVKQLSNDDLMKELQKQDREYLSQILRNQEEILSILSQIRRDMSAR